LPSFVSSQEVNHYTDLFQCLSVFRCTRMRWFFDTYMHMDLEQETELVQI